MGLARDGIMLMQMENVLGLKEKKKENHFK